MTTNRYAEIPTRADEDFGLEAQARIEATIATITANGGDPSGLQYRLDRIRAGIHPYAPAGTDPPPLVGTYNAPSRRS